MDRYSEFLAQHDYVAERALATTVYLAQELPRAA